MGYQALAFGALMVAIALGVLSLVRREARVAQQALLRETGRIEGKLAEARMEAGVMLVRAERCAERAEQSAGLAAAASEKVDEAKAFAGYALTSAARAALAAKRAQDASDRSTIASESAAQHAYETRNRAREARMWARITGAARARPVELRRAELEPEAEPAAELQPED